MLLGWHRSCARQRGRGRGAGGQGRQKNGSKVRQSGGIFAHKCARFGWFSVCFGYGWKPETAFPGIQGNSQ